MFTTATRTARALCLAAPLATLALMGCESDPYAHMGPNALRTSPAPSTHEALLRDAVVARRARAGDGA